MSLSIINDLIDIRDVSDYILLLPLNDPKVNKYYDKYHEYLAEVREFWGNLVVTLLVSPSSLRSSGKMLQMMCGLKSYSMKNHGV